MYIRCLEDVLDIFWTPYIRSIYVLCPGKKVTFCNRDNKKMILRWNKEYKDNHSGEILFSND